MDKTYWSANQGLPVLDSVAVSGGHNVIDDDRVLTSQSYDNLPYHSAPFPEPHKPWVQVKMDKQYWVKGVKLTQRSLWPNRHTHKEVHYL